MPGNLTIHFEMTSADARAKAFLAQGGVNTAFLLNANPEQIQYALDHVSGIVVVRVYDPFREFSKLGHEFEKDIVLRHDASDFVNWLNGQDLSRFKGNKRVRFILGWNEMFYAGPDYQRKQNKAMIAIADALIKAGYGVAMFGLAADKTIQKQDCEDGVWDSTIEFLIANEDWAHLDIHEYEVGRLASQHLKHYPIQYPRSIEDPASMAESNWGSIDYSGNTDNWHIGRIAWMLGRSRKQYGRDFYWARGEMGWDYKDDGALRDYIPQYMGRYGKPQGLPSLRPLFNQLMGKMLSDIELCEEANKDLRWFVADDPKSCLSNVIFADNPHSEHKNFNLGQSAYDHLYKLLGSQIVDNPPPPVEIPPEETMLVERRIKSTALSGDGTRIRSAAINGDVVGYVSPAFAIGKVEADYEIARLVTDISKPEAWVEIEIGGVVGYAAAKYLVIEELPPAPPDEPVYFLDFLGQTEAVTRATINRLIEIADNTKRYLLSVLDE